MFNLILLSVLCLNGKLKDKLPQNRQMYSTIPFSIPLKSILGFSEDSN
jgi:hypothetical protein